MFTSRKRLNSRGLSSLFFIVGLPLLVGQSTKFGDARTSNAPFLGARILKVPPIVHFLHFVYLRCQSTFLLTRIMSCNFMDFLHLATVLLENICLTSLKIPILRNICLILRYLNRIPPTRNNNQRHGNSLPYVSQFTFYKSIH
jgi:hypothetical protein